MQKVEKNFWIFLLLALITGLIFRQYGEPLKIMLTPLLMTILLLFFLKTDCLQILRQMRKPKFIIYILALFLIIISSAIYLTVRQFDETLAIGLLLLAATPPAVAAPVLTDLVKGNTELTLTITILTYTLSPITMPLLFIFWTSDSIEISPMPMFKVLLLMIFIPFLISQILKRTPAKNFVRKTQKHYGSINIILVTMVVFIAISIQGDYMVENPLKILGELTWVYGFFITMHILGYFAGFWRPKKDRIALSITNTYLNNALATVLALQFFTPQIVLITVLSQIPWNTMPGPFRWLMKKNDRY